MIGSERPFMNVDRALNVPPGRTQHVLILHPSVHNRITLSGRISQRRAHSSTQGNVGGLIFRVRDGYGSLPAAMAA